MKTLIGAFFFFSLCVPHPTAFAQPGVNARSEKLLTVRLRGADGEPLPHEAVICVGPETNVVLNGTIIEGGTERLVTDAEGRFKLLPNGNNLVLIAADDKGFCLAQSRDLTNGQILTLQTWGRIEGVRKNHDRPLVNHHLSFDLDTCWSIDQYEANRIDVGEDVKTDAKGRFVFEHVPPVAVWVEDLQLWLGANTNHLPFRCPIYWTGGIRPGETKRIEIATRGQTVIGQIELGAGVTNYTDLISLDESLARGIDLAVDWKKLNRPAVPEKFDTAEKRPQWWDEWYRSPIGRQRLAATACGHPVMISPDGSFIAELVVPGTYRIKGWLPYQRKDVAEMERQFSVPETESAAVDAPFDIGKVVLEATVNLKPGDFAPDFTSGTLENKLLKLSDFRGKYVLLDFWAAWCGPCVAETPHLKETYDAFGKNDRFVMVSLSLDDEREAPRKFVRKNGIAWIQGFLGNWSADKVSKRYGVSGIPAIFLIGPDGKVLATDLRGPKIKEAVTAALNSK